MLWTTPTPRSIDTYCIQRWSARGAGRSNHCRLFCFRAILTSRTRVRGRAPQRLGKKRGKLYPAQHARMGHAAGAENDLEVGIAWRSRTWNNVSDVPHPRHELHQSLEPETKARMWNSRSWVYHQYSAGSKPCSPMRPFRTSSRCSR